MPISIAGKELLDRAAAAPAAEVVPHTDDDLVSVHLPAHACEALLEARGWERRSGAWYSPAPERVRYWQLDEAITIALRLESRVA